MPPLSLDVRTAITILTGVLTIAGVIFGMKAAVAQLKDGQQRLQSGQDEGNRKIDALHKRLDYYGQEITRIDKEHVRLEERVESIKDTQRFLRARREAVRAGETPMFSEGDDG